MSSSSNSSSPHHHTVIIQLVATTPLRLCHRSRHPYATDNVLAILFQDTRIVRYWLHKPTRQSWNIELLLLGTALRMGRTVHGSFTEDAIGREGVTMQFVPVNVTASRGLDVVVGNLQEYYNVYYKDNV
ncbi:unnamed protein product [Lactuca saligna]|uniref:Uncharacterized protein n=1 Tax=Lactuca saligna TaxID=75948 RepID=A0AA35VMW8_LACSI|nr:unnamed protein product [Lactuca saligna]